MEKEQKTVEKNEDSLNKRDYSKEFSYLNEIRWLINFNIFESSTFCEDNFCTTIAWYIDNLQKEKPEIWEKEIKDLINSIKIFQWTESEKLKNLFYFFWEKKAIRFENNWWWDNAKIMRDLLTRKDSLNRLYTPNSEWKIKWNFPWIIKEAIPDRYYIRSIKSGLEDKIVNTNRSSLASTIRKQREKADELKKKL